MSELGVWQPLSPREVAQIFADFDEPWWIAGGWAIDAFLGRETREHGDIDVAVLRRDQLLAQDVLDGWDLQAADPPGKLRAWRAGETLPEDVHDVWCRPGREAAWGIQLMLDEADGDIWEYRRNPAVKRPLSRLVGRHDGIPYLAPEVQLLYKASRLSPANQADFEACLPHLDELQQTWLALMLGVAHPGHPWTERLQASLNRANA